MIKIFVLRKDAQALEPTGKEMLGVDTADEVIKNLNQEAKRHDTGEIFLAINDEPYTSDEKEVYEELAASNGY